MGNGDEKARAKTVLIRKCNKTLPTRGIIHDGLCRAVNAASPLPPCSQRKFAICHVNFSGDVLVAAGNALLRIAGCCYRRDKTELSHHADVIAGRVVIGNFAVSELQPVNMIGLEVFSGRRNAY